ncbi:MAG: hypothetical protein U1F36_12875 [Planctomycetota bacterium]
MALLRTSSTHRATGSALLHAPVLALLAVPCVLGAARAQDPPAPDTQAKPADQRPFIRGSLTSRYWLRSGESRSDQDIFETLSLDVGDPEHDAVTGYFVGRVAADIDGMGGDPTQFAHINDHFGNVYGRIYDAYVDFHRLPGLELARVGRQVIHETPEFAYFDGVRVESPELGSAKILLGAYGGASTHLYEDSSKGDWTFGAYGEGRFWTGGRVRIDWMHLEDEAVLGAHKNDLFTAGAWQNLCKGVDVDFQYGRLEDRDRDIRARLSFDDPDDTFTARLSYYQLLNTQRDLVVDLDPFFNALHDEFPYSQIGLLLTKGVTEKVDIQANVDARRLADRADAGTYNHDYERVYFTLDCRDVAVDGLQVALTGDLWHADNQEVYTWGVDVEKALTDELTASLGSYYSLYKFDLYLASERDNVRTWFFKLREKPSKEMSFDASYELEDSDIGKDHVFKVGMQWRF